MSSPTPTPLLPAKRNKDLWMLFAVLAICAAPLIASYFTYYVIKPESRTNYGTLLDPRAYPLPALFSTSLDGKPASLSNYKGKWILLNIDGSDCPEHCRKKLTDMRQLRLAQGKEMGRLERVWLVLDEQPLETMILREFDGTHILRSRRDELKAWLPVDASTAITDHIYLIDPLGNLMMRFPKDADANKVKRDLSRVLKASGIG